MQPKHIQAIHFVAGLGQRQGEPLAPDQLLAIDLAAALHQKAEVFLHTAPGSCDNYNRETTRRVRWRSEAYSKWPTWAIDHGAHMSDKLRLDVLLQANCYQHQLYIDTDAFCLRNLDYLCAIEGTAMARLSAFSIANGLIYQGPDKGYLRKLYSAMGASGGVDRHVSGSRLPQELAYSHPGLTVLDSALYHGVSGDRAYHGYWNEQHVLAEAPEFLGAHVAHVISSGTGQQWVKYAEGTNGARLLEYAKGYLSVAGDFGKAHEAMEAPADG